ncbi:MAG: hypothetical protein QN197_13265 [Armatimonadota bacterium]|nr:hypothetical protein [Armatimonadota bacterium]MDR7574351.1 hypothetical protein [Armatimonadota bacterium]
MIKKVYSVARLNAGAELDRRARALEREHGLPYAEAVHRVLAADPRLAAAYTGVPARHTDTRNDAAAEVDRRVRQWLVRHPKADYREGLRAVLRDDPELAARYLGKR